MMNCPNAFLFQQKIYFVPSTQSPSSKETRRSGLQVPENVSDLHVIDLQVCPHLMRQQRRRNKLLIFRELWMVSYISLISLHCTLISKKRQNVRKTQRFLPFITRNLFQTSFPQDPYSRALCVELSCVFLSFSFACCVFQHSACGAIFSGIEKKQLAMQLMFISCFTFSHTFFPSESDVILM